MVVGRFDSSISIHSEPQILDQLKGQKGGKLEITSLGPKGDGSTVFRSGKTKSGQKYSYKAGPLPPCGPKAKNCDALLQNYAKNNNMEITYRWNGNEKVYKPNGDVLENGKVISHCHHH